MLGRVAVKEADTKENISDDDDEASYSSSSSESSQSSSTDGEKSQQNDQSSYLIFYLSIFLYICFQNEKLFMNMFSFLGSPIIRKMSRESIEKKNKMQKKI